MVGFGSLATEDTLGRHTIRELPGSGQDESRMRKFPMPPSIRIITRLACLTGKETAFFDKSKPLPNPSLAGLFEGN